MLSGKVTLRETGANGDRPAQSEEASGGSARLQTCGLLVTPVLSH